MSLHKEFIFTLLFTSFTSLSLFAQTDCIQKEEDLAEAVRIDTVKIIDPETYDETMKITWYYVDDKVENIQIHDQKKDEVRQEVIRHEFNNNMDLAKAREKANRKVYYYEKGDCLKIYKIVQKGE
jgi:hypothetical protein